MSLTKEQKIIVANYVIVEDLEKAIRESTSLGQDYDEGNITEDDISDYINEIKERELKFLESEK
jgi:ornithine cyclodeaminase/alanine dehydrogenase-like protein (mu-crystallin family)